MNTFQALIVIVAGVAGICIGYCALEIYRAIKAGWFKSAPDLNDGDESYLYAEHNWRER